MEALSSGNFKKTLPVQADMFLDHGTRLSERKISILEDPALWDNMFFREAAQWMDEAVFEPLFEKDGRPNAPVCILWP